MKTESGSRSKRIAILAAVLLACAGLVIVLGRGQVTRTTDDSTKPLAGGFRSPGGGKPRERSDISSFSEHMLAADWNDRKDMLREALRSKEVPLEELWEIFQKLNELPGEKFSVSCLAIDLFSAYAEQDPATGLANFESLNAGIVRRQALMGFGSHLPAEYVPLLVDSVKSNGFPEEELSQIALQLHTAAKRYSAPELKGIIDAGYFDETAQQELTWMYESKLYRAANPIPIPDHVRVGGSRATPREGENFSLVDPPEKDTGEKETKSPAMAAFESNLSLDRFGAATGLQRGVFAKEIASPKVIKNVSLYLVSEDPARALTLAGNWDDARTREIAVGSVVWSWVRSDPGQCTEAISGIKDQQTKDIASAGVAEYLISHARHDEAAKWIEAISDPGRRKKAEGVLSRAVK